MTDTAFEAAALGKRFGRHGRRALDDCSFRLPAGRVCALVGPNGAGKSTLLGLAAGLLAPTEGRLTVLGTTPAAARERLAYVAQDKPLHPQLTVADTLRLGRELNPRRWDAPVAERILARGSSSPSARASWTPAPRSARCPAASAPASPSLSPSASGPSCCCSTSRWPTSTRWPATS
jgi:ABC-2 type transport system ATP-binding protein